MIIGNITVLEGRIVFVLLPVLEVLTKLEDN